MEGRGEDGVASLGVLEGRGESGVVGLSVLEGRGEDGVVGLSVLEGRGEGDVVSLGVLEGRGEGGALDLETVAVRALLNELIEGVGAGGFSCLQVCLGLVEVLVEEGASGGDEGQGEGRSNCGADDGVAAPSSHWLASYMVCIDRKTFRDC